MPPPERSDARSILSHDTTPDIEQKQIDLWRRMSSGEKVSLVSALARDIRELAEAGIRERHPAASERERFLRLAILMLGGDLARQVYPDAAALFPAT